MTRSRMLLAFGVAALSLAAASCAYTKAGSPTVTPNTTTPSAYYWINPTDAKAEKACIAKGGVISTQDLQKICVQPAQVTSFMITDTSPYSAKACTDKRGVISTNATGRSVCTLPSVTLEPELGWSCETCNKLCDGPCFMNNEFMCICYPTRFFTGVFVP
jgi:hypothetical protein